VSHETALSRPRHRLACSLTSRRHTPTRLLPYTRSGPRKGGAGRTPPSRVARRRSLHYTSALRVKIRRSKASPSERGGAEDRKYGSGRDSEESEPEAADGRAEPTRRTGDEGCDRIGSSMRASRERRTRRSVLPGSDNPGGKLLRESAPGRRPASRPPRAWRDPTPWAPRAAVAAPVPPARAASPPRPPRPPPQT